MCDKTSPVDGLLKFKGITMNTAPYMKKKSLFAKQMPASKLAEAELEDINHKLLHYQNEQMLVNKQVNYLEERKKQLRNQIREGYFSNFEAPVQQTLKVEL